MRLIFALLATIALAACAPTMEELAAADDATCTSYGFTAGTPDYGMCRLDLAKMRIDQQRADAAWSSAMSSSLGNAALALQPITMPPPQQQPTTCRTMRLTSGMLRTTCN